jgi:hypothetical protein
LVGKIRFFGEFREKRSPLDRLATKIEGNRRFSNFIAHYCIAGIFTSRVPGRAIGIPLKNYDNEAFSVPMTPIIPIKVPCSEGLPPRLSCPSPITSQTADRTLELRGVSMNSGGIGPCMHGPESIPESSDDKGISHLPRSRKAGKHWYLILMRSW